MNTTELVRYFAAEKNAAVLLLGLALAGVAFGVYLRVGGSPFRAMAWVLFATAAVQVAVGATLLVRTEPQVLSLQQGMVQEPATTVLAERERMAKVNRSWRPIKAIEVALITLGVALIALGTSRGHAWSAVGMGLVIEAAVMLVFDVFAEQRAAAYSAWLGNLVLNPG